MQVLASTTYMNSRRNTACIRSATAICGLNFPNIPIKAPMHPIEPLRTSAMPSSGCWQLTPDATATFRGRIR